MGGVVSRNIRGTLEKTPEQLFDCLSEEESRMLQDSLQNLNLNRVLDAHGHVCGLGSENSGCYVNKSVWKNPVLHYYSVTKFKSFLRAGRISDVDPHADWHYVKQLVRLIRSCSTSSQGSHPKMLVFALDSVHSNEGLEDLSLTSLKIPNEHVFAVVQAYPDVFEMGMSIHPYRKDVLEEIETWHAKGIRVMKWIPQTMRIDLQHIHCSRVYAKLRELDITLVIHSGNENSFDFVRPIQEFGNPLKLIYPLKGGVKVIAAHCASEGSIALKLCGLTFPCFRKPNYDFLIELMEMNEFKDLLFADVSSMISRTRSKYLVSILKKEHLHSRLIYGSDYPLVAVKHMVSTFKLCYWQKLINQQQKQLLDKIREYNPVLFSLVACRMIGTPLRLHPLPDSVFYGDVLEKKQQ
jgi:predicted TIM-barrel fold metal-dependent hydrolase